MLENFFIAEKSTWREAMRGEYIQAHTLSGKQSS